MISGQRNDEDRAPSDAAWRAVDHATTLAVNPQEAILSRFGNFLLADSFLLLAWATLYAVGQTRARTAVLAVLALTSTLLGGVFALLGRRYKEYADCHWDLVAQAECALDERFRIAHRVGKLGDGETVEVRDREYQIPRLATLVNLYGALVWVPAALGVASLFLFAMSFANH